MRILLATTITAALLAGLAGPAAAAPRRDDPTYGIDVQKVGGTGCRQKDTVIVLSNDNMAMTVMYSGYATQLGKKAKAAHKECRIKLKLRAPKGSRYSVTGVYQRGFADIATGAAGTFTAAYGHPNSKPVYANTRRFTPQPAAVWQDNTPADLDWSPCEEKKVFLIDTDLDLKGKGAEAKDSSLTLDSSDADVATRFSLRWEKCR
ncbi:hypothetical protein GCM10010123_27570 [Pilimelia anulata]|uniref:DUF4360 domain-containing protein n=1 Tax=Pilimelia anulata TaxID=53371 RepID=A0A8J3FDH0_9ACTN|nr:DUF4360 domain-containing protein [Pilimelia anulata]GGJ96106.1 hypothetical protein GCM10010123_27570 [Pilimelia anulata]